MDVDEVPYSPGMHSFELTAPTGERYVLYRYRNPNPSEVWVDLLGVFSMLEDALCEARTRGDGRKSKAMFAWQRGQHFDVHFFNAGALVSVISLRI